MIDTTTVVEIHVVDPDTGMFVEYRVFSELEEAYDWIDEKERDALEVNINEYRVGECACGATVELVEFTNECDNCGLLFNPFGQEVRY